MYEIFCDLDGVLADFDRGIYELTGSYPKELPLKEMWKSAAKARGFYTHLEWMSDGHLLWDYIKEREPTILTGKPMGTWAEPQKLEWCGRELGKEVAVEVCWTRDKHLWSGKNKILIDDREKTAGPWAEAGGIFILHTSAENSIAQLKALGL